MQISLEPEVIHDLYDGARSHRSLSLEQAASLFALLAAHKSGWKQGTLKLIPKAIEQLITDACRADASGSEQVQKEVVVSLRQISDVKEFVEKAHQAGFLAPEDDENDDPSVEFSLRYAERALVDGGKVWRLQDEQDRALRIIESEKDEHINIEGLAGSGKTYLTSALGEVFSAKTTLLVGATPHQLRALKNRLPGFRGATFASLARQSYADYHGVMPQLLAPRYHPGFSRSWEEISSEMGFPQVCNLSPKRFAWLAANVVQKFCYGDAKTFDLQLFPWKYRQLFPTNADRWQLMHAAQELWEAIMRPPNIFSELPVRSYHLMKWLDLKDSALSVGEITHLIFDEAHDVPPAMLRLIDASRLTAISLGDRYQYLGGGEPGRRAEKIRPYYFQHSLRSGFNLSGALNSVLEFHSHFEGYEFIGNPERKTRQVPYERLNREMLARVAQEPGATAILSGRIWTVFSTVQRLATSNIPFCLLTSPEKLFGAVQGALRIYQGNAHLNTDPYTINCKNWDELRLQEGVVIEGLLKAFSQGFQVSDLEGSIGKADSRNPKAIRVGLVEEAKNREFDNVVLTSDIRYGNYKVAQTRNKIVSSVYTGMTRGLRSVYYQEDMIDIMLDSIKSAMG